MYRFALLIVAVMLLSCSIAQAASYEKTSGTIVDPILDYIGCCWSIVFNTHPYSGTNLEPSANLSGADLTNAYLTGANLSGANLTNANLTNAYLFDADLSNAILSGANLTYADLDLTNLAGANLAGANLTYADLDWTNLAGANLTGVSSGGITSNPQALPTNWQLIQGYLIGPGANLSGAYLSDAYLTNADLTDADLTGANLTGVRSGGITGNPSNVPTDWQLTQGYLIGPGANLTGAALTGANLTYADLSDANLSGANLSGANLTYADLDFANLAGANLTDVSSGGITSNPGALPTNWQLIQGYLIGPGANLSGATLTYTNLTGATLTGANLHQALLPSAMPTLPVINGAVVTVASPLAVSGSVQVGGILSVTSDTFTTTGVSMQGGTVAAALYGLDLDEIGDISGYGQLFGHVALGTDGAIAGSRAGLELFGHVSGSGTISGATLFGNLNIGSSPGAITLEDVVMSEFATTTFEIAGTDPSQFDQLILIGSVALDGTAQISFDGFAPDLADTFQLLDLTDGTASSWFSSVVAPEGWTLSSDGLLAIPEPSSALLLGIGILCVAGYRRDSLV